MLNRYFILTLLSGLTIAPQVTAAGSIWYTDGDPLSTSLELPPAVYGVGFKPEIAGQSCADLDFSKALTLADVTEAVLCNNPQTRESYANAKVQAAQLGIAKSAFLPTLASRGLPRSPRTSMSQRCCCSCHLGPQALPP